MTISKARVLALLQPVIAVASGAIATWLLVHVHLLGIFNISHSQAATDIASGTVFVIMAGLSWLAQHEHLIPITTAFRVGAAPPKSSTLTAAEIVALLTPYISVIAGALASWLFVHVHFLGIFHVAQKGVAGAVASAIVFAVVTILTWLSHRFHILPVLFPGKVAHKRAPKAAVVVPPAANAGTTVAP